MPNCHKCKSNKIAIVLHDEEKDKHFCQPCFSKQEVEAALFIKKQSGHKPVYANHRIPPRNQVIWVCTRED